MSGVKQVYVIHVKGAKDRKAHIDNLLIKYPYFNTSFTEYGNIAVLSTDILDKYFKDTMHQPSAFVSCAYKHILSLEKLLLSNEKWVLILEDDINFYSNFDRDFKLIVQELETRKISNAVISLEDSLPKYIPRSKRKKNQFLYSANQPRLTGANLIDQAAAKNMLEYIAQHKCHLPWDWFFKHCIENNLIDCYWSQPAIACQGSLNGSLPSLIDKKKTGNFRILDFWAQRTIKKLRAFFS